MLTPTKSILFNHQAFHARRYITTQVFKLAVTTKGKISWVERSNLKV